ncbi:MAG: hypothetical protein NPINA01_30380 [Nitrospinaceae bacterium]|nr:MAG: hypothetical protein NPINA01_30380 [Nitrospinaceae bacterium]
MNPSDGKINVNQKTEEKSIRWMKLVLFGSGGVFILVGVIRQWPIVGKTYMQFIEGDGYLSLMLGLIMVVLGFSVRLFTGEEEVN